MSRPALFRLEASDVRSLQTLRATGNFEFNRLAFVQRLVSLRLNRGEMTKTSSPDWRWMNPNPLLALNHFTVPCSLTDVLTFLFSYLCF